MATPDAWIGEAERLRRFTSSIGRFWSRVDKSGECWIWTGAKTAAGYGEIYLDGRMVYAHRLSSEMAEGPIPEGIFILHKCDRPDCVKPEHLFRGTHQANMDDMWAKGRGNPGRHPFGDEHPRAKVTDDQVVEIRRRRWAGESRATLAAEFGITPQYVGDLATGRSRSRADA